MPSYSYVAVSGRGKRVRDSMEAASLDMAKNSLRGAGYTILEIKARSLVPALVEPETEEEDPESTLIRALEEYKMLIP